MNTLPGVFISTISKPFLDICPISDYTVSRPVSDNFFCESRDVMQALPISSSLRDYNQLIRETDQMYHDIAKGMALSDCAMWILYTLRTEEAALSLSSLGDLLCYAKQTLHSALKGLEADGYITLSPAVDKRRKQIVLTEEGYQLAQRTVDQLIDAEDSAIHALTPQEQRALLALLRKLTDQTRQMAVQRQLLSSK